MKSQFCPQPLRGYSYVKGYVFYIAGKHCRTMPANNNAAFSYRIIDLVLLTPAIADFSEFLFFEIEMKL
jgi:hypothetical protein